MLPKALGSLLVAGKGLRFLQGGVDLLLEASQCRIAETLRSFQPEREKHPSSKAKENEERDQPGPLDEEALLAPGGPARASCPAAPFLRKAGDGHRDVVGTPTLSSHLHELFAGSAQIAAMLLQACGHLIIVHEGMHPVGGEEDH